MLGHVERRDEVEVFDGASFGMIEVPADDLVLVGVGLLLNRVVDDEYRIVALDLAQSGFTARQRSSALWR